MSSRLALADTGAVFALLDRDDSWYAPVRAWWSATTLEVRLPEPILPEVAYLLGTRIGPDAELAFVQAIATGDLVVEPLELEDHARAAAIMERYLDVPLGMVDASVAAVAERLEVTTLLTTDRRHFALIRPAHRPGFLLVP